jgi:hypothetical protein
MSTAADTRETSVENHGDRRSVDRGPQSDAVFPLKLVPFERYMLADDRPAYPMTYVVSVQLNGEPNREAMDAAFADALKRHPLLTARLTRRGFSRRWISANDPSPVLLWSKALPGAEIRQGKQVDLGASVALSGEMRVASGRTELLLSFHHAACDGIGALQLVGDILAYYGLRTASPALRPRLLPVNAANLQGRGVFDVRVPGPVSRWEVIKSTVREGWKVVSRRPLSVGPCRRERVSQPTPGPALMTTTLPESLYLQYIAQASTLGVSVNDLLLRDMFIVVDAWNRQQNDEKCRGWLRVNMPTSLRGRRDARMPAANILGYALVTHHTDECRDPARLLSEIAAETAAIRTWSMGALFVEALRIADRVPGLLYLGSRISRRFSTAVLSNVGDPVRRFRARFPRTGKEIQVGDLTLKSVSGAPPVRPGTRVALGLNSYADRLVIGMNRDPRCLDESAGRRFLHAYRSQLQQTAQRDQRSQSPELP